MSAITAPYKVWSIEEFLALPDDDGMDRWLIHGELREKEMTKRNRFHGRLEARIAQLLGMWLDSQPEPRGEVYSGVIGMILSRSPATSVGIDVAYVSHGVVVSQEKKTTLIEGCPTLAVEVLSPSDTVEDINEKVEEYQQVGVPLVWLVEPYSETITVYRQDRMPEMFNMGQEISAEPHLPGFTLPASKIFRR